MKEMRERRGFFGASDGRCTIGGPMTDKTSSFSTWFRVVRDKWLSRCARVAGASLNLDGKIRARALNPSADKSASVGSSSRLQYKLILKIKYSA